MREGNDLTIVTFSKMVGYALKVRVLGSCVFSNVVAFFARLFIYYFSEFLIFL